MLKIKLLKIKHLCLLCITFIFLIGCAAQQAKVDFDQNTEINTLNYKTFAWLTNSKIIGASPTLNPVMKGRVDEAIENSFIKRGYQLVNDPEKADFAISYTMGSRDKMHVTQYPAMYQGNMRWGRGYYGGMGMATETHVSQYTEGKLAIDIFDVKSHQPVWHGWATKRISSSDKEDPNKTITTIVEQVIAQFK